MKHPLHHLLLLASVAIVPSLAAQTLTEANSIPAIGTVENRTYYTDFSASGLATSGTGNTWNAMGVTAFGLTSTTTYRAPGDSPYAATYPSTTICAEALTGLPPAEWRHFHVTSSVAELLGASADEFIGGRTYCEYPFGIGDSFTDTYTVGGNANTDVVEYVASGEIQAPWGTIQNVVMFQINGGPYTFYGANNLLDAIGSYLPGFGLDLWQVEVVSAINEYAIGDIGICPVPASDIVRMTLPLGGASVITVQDAAGRTVELFTSLTDQVVIDLRSFEPGLYTVIALEAGGRRATGRFVVE